MSKYKEVLMENRAQINAFIDKKNEESVYGVNNASADKFFRYYGVLSRRLQGIESEISKLTQSKVKMNFLFQPKGTRKLQKLIGDNSVEGSSRDITGKTSFTTSSSPFSSTSGSQHGSASIGTGTNMQYSASSYASGSASPLKVLMQSLFATNLSET